MKAATLSKIIFLIIILLSFTPLVYRQILFFSYESEKGLFFRLLIEIAFGIWLILILKDSDYRPKHTPINFAIICLAIILFIVDANGVDASLSYFSNFERMAGLMMYLTVFAFYFIIASILNTPKRWLIFGISLLVVSFIIACYGIFKNENLEVYGGRAISTLGNPNQLAIYLLFGVFTLPIVYNNIILKLNKSQPLLKVLIFPISIIFTLVYLFCLYKTATRGVIFSFLFSFLIVAIFFFIHKTYILKKKIAYYFIFLGFTIGLTFYVNRSTQSKFDYTTFSRLTHFNKVDGTNTISDRLENYKIALGGIKEKPFFGWGQENYHYIFAKYYNPKLYKDSIWYDRSHNSILDWLLTGGLVGLIAYLSLWATIIYQLWRKTVLSFQTKLLISAFALAYFLSLFSFFDSLLTLMSFMIMAAFVQFNIPDIRKEKNARLFWTKLNIKYSHLGIVIFIISIIYFTVIQPFKANLSVAKAFKANNLDEVVAQYKNAYDISSLNNLEIAEQLGALSQQVSNSTLGTQTKQNYFQTTMKIIDAELVKRPNYVRLQILKGNLFETFGNTIEAEKVFETVQILAPKRQDNLEALANILIKNNKKQRALKILENAFILDTNHTDLKVKLAYFYALNADTTSRNNLIDQINHHYFCKNIELIKQAFELTSDQNEFYKSCFKKLIGNKNTQPKDYYLWAINAFNNKNYKQASSAVYAFRRHYNNEKLFLDQRFAEQIRQNVLNGENPEQVFLFADNTF